jgi:hypothetical protein
MILSHVISIATFLPMLLTPRLASANTRLLFSLAKSDSIMDVLTLDGVSLLGTRASEPPTPGGPTGNGLSGVGIYLDCYCVAAGNGAYTPGRNASYRVFEGTDADGVAFAGYTMTDRHASSGQVMQFSAVLRDGETGLHTWGRVTYTRAEGIVGPTRPALQELRTLFRPNADMWTHMVTNGHTVAPRPRSENVRAAEMVQDATVDLAKWPDDPYVRMTNRYFTKYSFADTWGEHEAHGMYGTQGNGTWGAWMVMWNRENYYGGPGHGDLTVDGIVYDYFGMPLSSHVLRSCVRVQSLIDTSSLQPLRRQRPLSHRRLRPNLRPQLLPLQPPPFQHALAHPLRRSPRLPPSARLPRRRRRPRPRPHPALLPHQLHRVRRAACVRGEGVPHPVGVGLGRAGQCGGA